MKEEEIRPKKIFDEYLRLASEDTEFYFRHADRVNGVCPACLGVGKPAFIKFGFTYDECPNCLSLYVNSRPHMEAFSRYYTESPSSKFWASTFYKETAEARREKLWKPKAKLILDILEKYDAKDQVLIDIGGGFGLFAEEVRNICGRAPIIIEPDPDLAAVCQKKSLSVVQKFLEDIRVEDLPAGSKTFVSFELFEHLHDPVLFLQKLNGLMASNDFFIFTTLSSAGVDIQALWQDSKSVTPPHHLNFFNPHSITMLLTRLGFMPLEVTTPGKLDIDILSNNQVAIKDRFWQNFIFTATENEKAIWQGLIASSGRSSHMMVVCRKL